MLKQINSILPCLIALAISIISSFILCKWIIKIQLRRKVYQPLRDELIPLHGQKKSTPTLGGIAIFFSSLIPCLIIYNINFLTSNLFKYILIFGGFFAIGMVDDLLKLLKRNYHGINEIFRIVIEMILSLILLRICGFNHHDFQYFNLFGFSISLGIIAIIVFSFIFVGSANAMNLCDGLDGLATCLFIIALMPFIIYIFSIGDAMMGTYLISVFGACIGFLILNMHPSKIFMGDAGSLYLGAILGGISIIYHLESILMIAGAVLIVETLSVIIQVISFKLRGKRIFLMAPLHHHFEQLGFKEERVVLLFIVVAYFFSFIAVVILL